MDEKFIFDSSYITGIHLEDNFGNYSMSCKTGYFCDFNLIQLSNQPHFHKCYELHVVTSGEGEFVYGDETYTIQKGDIFIADPNIVHEIVVNKSQDLQLIYFFIEIEGDKFLEPKNSRDWTIHSFLIEHNTVVRSQTHLLAYLLFVEKYSNGKKSTGFGIYQALKNLILESIDALSVKGGNLSKDRTYSLGIFELALDYIDQNLDSKITVSGIAKHLFTSTRNLQYIFKKQLGRTIVDYINEKKMILGAHYLAKQFSVSETATHLEIENTSQFTRLFKEYIGITPKKYQQNHISKVREFGRRQQNLDL